MWIFLLLSLLFSSAINAQTITLSSYKISGLIESETQGSMIEMLNIIEQNSHLRFELELMPIKRVQYSFRQEKILGYFPELEEFRPQNSCRSEAFMQKKIIAVTRQNDQLITRIEQLEGRKIGAVSGFSYGLNIINNPLIKIDRVFSEEANLKKLMSGRIDTIIGDAHATLNAIKKAKLEKQLRFDISNPINLLDVFFVFHPDTEGENRCTYLSEEINKLKSDGTLFRLFGYQ